MDNPLDQGFTPNRSAHVHHYVLKGSAVFWAECECGDKLAGPDGPIVGSRAKVEKAMAA